MRILISILFLYIMSCAQPLGSYVEPINKPNIKMQVVPVYSTGIISEKDELGIKYALEQWNYVLNGNLRFEYIDRIDTRIATKYLYSNKYKEILIIAKFPVEVFDEKNIPDKTLGFVDGKYKTIIFLLEENINEHKVPINNIIIHEVAHILGVHHNQISGSIMNESYFEMRYNCIDKVTMLSAANVNNWDWHTMRYCITKDLN